MVQETQTGHGLVPMDTPVRRGAGTRHHLAHSAFLAHLLATRLDAPVTRRLRRASPAAAIACYQTAAALGRSTTLI